MYIVRGPRYQPTPIPLSSAPYMQVIRGFQIGSYVLVRLLDPIMTQHRVKLDLEDADLEPSMRYVIAANHQSRIDPYIITCQLPLSMFRRLGPFRLFAYLGLFKHPLLRFLMTNSGSFPIRDYHNLPYGIEAARAFLGRGQTIVIFPEGRRSLPGTAVARNGVGVLAENERVRIIPAHIQWHRGRWQSGFRRSYQLTIGKPLERTTSSEDILAAIYRLELPK